MATGLVIEEECGTYAGRAHPHNGYYAGDFSKGADRHRTHHGPGVRHPPPPETVAA